MTQSLLENHIFCLPQTLLAVIKEWFWSGASGIEVLFIWSVQWGMSARHPQNIFWILVDFSFRQVSMICPQDCYSTTPGTHCWEFVFRHLLSAWNPCTSAVFVLISDLQSPTSLLRTSVPLATETCSKCCMPCLQHMSLGKCWFRLILHANGHLILKIYVDDHMLGFLWRPGASYLIGSLLPVWTFQSLPLTLLQFPPKKKNQAPAELCILTLFLSLQVTKEHAFLFLNITS